MCSFRIACSSKVLKSSKLFKWASAPEFFTEIAYSKRNRKLCLLFSKLKNKIGNYL